jgi:hypothetical protein
MLGLSVILKIPDLMERKLVREVEPERKRM